MSNTFKIDCSKAKEYDEKYDLMFGLLIAYNSYCINYYVLEPELSYKTSLNQFDIELELRTLRELEISRRFSFHTMVVNFLNSAFIVENSMRRFARKINCNEMSNILICKIDNLDISLNLVKEIRNTYVHGKLVPLHFNYVKTLDENGFNTVFNLLAGKEYLLSLKNIKAELRQYLESISEQGICLYDLFKRHIEFNFDLYNSIRDEFIKRYVVCDTTRLLHEKKCLINGIPQDFSLLKNDRSQSHEKSHRTPNNNN